MNLNELFARYYLGVARPNDYIEWAEDQLLAGSESKNMALLASMDFDKPIGTYELLDYFNKCIAELNVEWPDKKTSLRDYSKTVCLAIISGKLEPQTGLHLFLQFNLASNYSENLFRIWGWLEEDISLLETGFDPTFNNGLLEGTDLYIKQVASQYLKLLEVSLPHNFFELIYCSHCHHIGLPEHKEVVVSSWNNFFKGKKPIYLQQVCSNCSSDKIYSMWGYEGREAYLKKMKEHNENNKEG